MTATPEPPPSSPPPAGATGKADERAGARRTFRRRDRLGHALEFQAAYAGRVCRTRGPLVVFGRPNALAQPRLGLSVGRRVGPAVVRNRVKRLLREAFRLRRDELPVGLDLVVNVRPHVPLRLAAYQQHLVEAAASLGRHFSRQAGAPPTAPPASPTAPRSAPRSAPPAPPPEGPEPAQ